MTGKKTSHPNMGVHPNKGKYHEWTTPEGLIIVQGWARDGLSNKQIAKNIGINEGTFYEWQKAHPKFKEAVKKGKEVIDREVENALFNRAIEGDATSMIFWLKNRKPQEWNDRRQVEHSGTMNNNISNFTNVSDETLKEAVENLRNLKNEKE